MGTLTGDAPALEGHCLHKLPTSCRLTATLDCCACQDQRPHAPTYQTYVDGIGMVSRGTRWQRYCWFCKEFWENRVQAEGYEPRLTEVPRVPNQETFCSTWHDYRRGYKIVDDPSGGSVRNEPLAPERPWRDVAPGFLPTFNQPEASRQAEAAPAYNATGPHISVEEALDSLLDAESAQDRVGQTPRARQRRGPPDEDAQGARARVRHVPPTEDQIQAARLQANEAEQRRRQIVAELAAAEQELRTARQRHTQLLQAQASARNMERVFGTREDFLREGASYVSPLTSMFARAYDRYRTAEEVRAAERASDANLLNFEDYVSSLHAEPRLQDVVLQEADRIEEAEIIEQPHSLDDERIVRPPPKSDAEMRISLACRICLQQVADTATLPCGHLVMCSYCAAVAVPTKDEAQTQPLRRNANCPQCRKQVKRIARIYTA